MTTCLAVPRKWSDTAEGRAISMRLGVRFMGVDCPQNVAFYDMDLHSIEFMQNFTVHGITYNRGVRYSDLNLQIEPYWREDATNTRQQRRQMDRLKKKGRF